MRLHQVKLGGALALAVGLVLALPASAAGPFGRDMQFRPFAQQQQQRPPRDFQRDADRRTPQRDNTQNDRGTLSPEDRRQLRRDINDAGRDIYRGPAQGQGQGQRPGQGQGQGQRQRRGQ